MSQEDKQEIDYGPLAPLIGVWKGDKGIDIAPEKDGPEQNPYFETITFTEVGAVTNAGSQNLVALRYHQVVSRKSNGEVFHDETGYWMWDPERQTVAHSLVIPRAVGVLAGGTGVVDSSGKVVLEVSAGLNNPDWGIVQSPFMRDKAKTVAFTHKITAAKDTLEYVENTVVEIYGETFQHSDQNTLGKVL